MTHIHVRPAVGLAAFTALALAICGVMGDNAPLSFDVPGVTSSAADSAIEPTLRVDANRSGLDEDSQVASFDILPE